MYHAPFHHTFKRARLRTSYVCLSCRLKVEPALRNTETSWPRPPNSPQFSSSQTKARDIPTHAYRKQESAAGTFVKRKEVPLFRKYGAAGRKPRALQGRARDSPPHIDRKKKSAALTFEKQEEVPIFRKQIKSITTQHDARKWEPSQIPKNTTTFNVDSLKWTLGVHHRVREVGVAELAQTVEFGEALDGHGLAAEDVAEGLKSKEHTHAECEKGKIPSPYRPLFDHRDEKGKDAYDIDLGAPQRSFQYSDSSDRSLPLGSSPNPPQSVLRTPVRRETDSRHSLYQAFEDDAQEATAKTNTSKHLNWAIGREPDVVQSSAPRIPNGSEHGDGGFFNFLPIYPSNPRLMASTKFPLGQDRSRLFHTSTRSNQQAVATTKSPPIDEAPAEFPSVRTKAHKYSNIRQQLRQWQDENGNVQEDTKPQPVFDIDESSLDGVMNSMTRLPDMNIAMQQSAVQDEEERLSISQMPTTDSHDGLTTDSANAADIFLKPGDLVELDFSSAERNSIIAVFIQRVAGSEAQFFTMQGRWVVVHEKSVQWSLVGWASKADVAPLIECLPKPKDQVELAEMREKSQVEDLSVPRSVSAPLVTRLVKFWTESQGIYRQYASVLDNAHNLLAHETDLRYGSLVSASSTLLQIPVRELPATALYAVRTALGRAPLAFNIDRRSHRMTGYIQIRSKEQVRLIQYVRDWLRDWQDDVASQSQMSADGRKTTVRKDRIKKGAQYIYSFLEKARTIVLQSREHREFLPYKCGNIGISNKRFPISEDSQAVRITHDTQFTEQDQEIVRFIEAWCATGTLKDVIAYAALPPMILQATGLYEQFDTLDIMVGFTFLQELGVMLPYENRITFDPHLLLPSSQHSKPLQSLMENMMKMHHNPQFSDSMSHLRRDWGSLPVFCVDDAGAQEIDDGVSIEPVEGKEGEHWLRVHTANPTAFFERDNPLAKMARHLGESIYMPEKAHTMLPYWATRRHFSLAKDRPCITFSMRVDSNGNVLECEIVPGIVRNVITLTPDEVTNLIGEKNRKTEKLTLTVGGKPPPETIRTSMAGAVTEGMAQSLQVMRMLTEKLHNKRLARGGLFMDKHDNEVSVWQSTKGQGLAWNKPWRSGSRTVEGDPVIQMKTRGFTNWFAPQVEAGVSMIREMMLLAGEAAATWCSDRGIPTIFRGTVRHPDSPDGDAFYREVLAPALEEHGEVPPYLGLRYLPTQGASALRTTAFPHKIAGLRQYAKSTSPLRRYGDMIVHWQIEAALREEARLGRSLTPADTRRNSSFLPFSANVLQTIMVGLAPREKLITRVKAYARDFWVSMVLFRAHHFGECELPFAATTADHVVTGKPLMKVFLHSQINSTSWCTGVATQVNTAVIMQHPQRSGLGEAIRGDVWEVEVDYVDVYRRAIVAVPLRLVDRPVDERLERWKSVVP